MIYPKTPIIRHYRREVLAPTYKAADHIGLLVVVLIIGLVVGLCLECVRWQVVLHGLVCLIVSMALLWITLWRVASAIDEKIRRHLDQLATQHHQPKNQVQERLLQIIEMYQR